MKLEFSRQIFGKYSNIKLHENMSSGSWVVQCGRTDMMKLTVSFRSFARTPKIYLLGCSTVCSDTELLILRKSTFVAWTLWGILLPRTTTYSITVAYFGGQKFKSKAPPPARKYYNRSLLILSSFSPTYLCQEYFEFEIYRRNTKWGLENKAAQAEHQMGSRK